MGAKFIYFWSDPSINHIVVSEDWAAKLIEEITARPTEDEGLLSVEWFYVAN